MASSPLASVAATRDVLERHGLSTKKSLGQHFLVNDHIVGRICDLADVREGDLVMEVGPGIGTLTAALLARGAQVVAIEADRALPEVIADTCAPWADRLTVINADALEGKKKNPRFIKAQDMADAVKAAAENTAPGKACILSPAAASYNVYRNFEEKGRDFKRRVEEYFAEGKGEFS